MRMPGKIKSNVTCRLLLDIPNIGNQSKVSVREQNELDVEVDNFRLGFN